MEPAPAFHFDLALHPTKDTIKLIASLLEKVIIVNENARINNNNNNNNNNNTDKANDSAIIDGKDDQPDPAIDNHRHNDDNHGSSRRPSTSNIYTCFHARSIPSISIQAYLIRILKYCPCANECFLAILVYFDRMTKADPPARTMPLQVNSYNVHRLIIAGVMIASKLFSDVFFTNTRYAKVGGLPVSELNILEVEFLALNEYNMFVTIDEFQYYGDQLLLHWMKDHGDGQDLQNLVNYRSLTHTRTDMDGDSGMTPRQSDQEFNTAQISRATRQLSIDKTNGIPPITTPMKDANRKSDEIDQHRLFKRPSSRAVTGDQGGDSTQPSSYHSAQPSTTSYPSSEPKL